MNTTLQLSTPANPSGTTTSSAACCKNGELAGMIARGEIRGVTSNPTIFMNAVTKSSDYDASLPPLAKAGLTPEQIFFALAIEDIQAAADLFLPLYQESQRRRWLRQPGGQPLPGERHRRHPGAGQRTVGSG